MRYLECCVAHSSRRAFPRARRENASEGEGSAGSLGREKKKERSRGARFERNERENERRVAGATRARANVCAPCGGALFTRQLMSSETRRKLWTSRTAGAGCSFTEAASGSAVERELPPNGSGEKMERRGEDVRRNPKYSRCLAPSGRLCRRYDCAIADNKNVDSSFLDAASCAKMALETRGTVDTQP